MHVSLEASSAFHVVVTDSSGKTLPDATIRVETFYAAETAPERWFIGIMESSEPPERARTGADGTATFSVRGIGSGYVSPFCVPFGEKLPSRALLVVEKQGFLPDRKEMAISEGKTAEAEVKLPPF